MFIINMTVDHKRPINLIYQSLQSLTGIVKNIVNDDSNAHLPENVVFLMDLACKTQFISITEALASVVEHLNTIQHIRETATKKDADKHPPHCRCKLNHEELHGVSPFDILGYPIDKNAPKISRLVHNNSNDGGAGTSQPTQNLQSGIDLLMRPISSDFDESRHISTSGILDFKNGGAIDEGPLKTINTDMTIAPIDNEVGAPYVSSMSEKEQAELVGRALTKELTDKYNEQKSINDMLFSKNAELVGRALTKEHTDKYNEQKLTSGILFSEKDYKFVTEWVPGIIKAKKNLINRLLHEETSDFLGTEKTISFRFTGRENINNNDNSSIINHNSSIIDYIINNEITSFASYGKKQNVIELHFAAQSINVKWVSQIPYIRSLPDAEIINPDIYALRNLYGTISSKKISGVQLSDERMVFKLTNEHALSTDNNEVLDRIMQRKIKKISYYRGYDNPQTVYIEFDNDNDMLSVLPTDAQKQFHDSSNDKSPYSHGQIECWNQQINDTDLVEIPQTIQPLIDEIRSNDTYFNNFPFRNEYYRSNKFYYTMRRKYVSSMIPPALSESVPPALSESVRPFDVPNDINTSAGVSVSAEQKIETPVEPSLDAKKHSVLTSSYVTEIQREGLSSFPSIATYEQDSFILSNMSKEISQRLCDDLSEKRCAQNAIAGKGFAGNWSDNIDQKKESGKIDLITDVVAGTSSSLPEPIPHNIDKKIHVNDCRCFLCCTHVDACKCVFHLFPVDITTHPPRCFCIYCTTKNDPKDCTCYLCKGKNTLDESNKKIIKTELPSITIPIPRIETPPSVPIPQIKTPPSIVSVVPVVPVVDDDSVLVPCPDSARSDKSTHSYGLRSRKNIKRN